MRLSFEAASPGGSRTSIDGASPRGSFELSRTSQDGGSRTSLDLQRPGSGSGSGSSSPLGNIKGTFRLGGGRKKADGDKLRKAALHQADAPPDPAATATLAAELERELWAFVEEDEARKTATPTDGDQIVANSGLIQALPGLGRLRTLVLEHNHFVRPFSVTSVVRSLVCLRLGYNLLVSLDGLSDRPLMQLEELFVNHNRLRNFFRDADLETQFPNLKVLDARHNNLESHSLHGLLPRNLVYLYLSDNSLHTIPAHLLDNQSHLTWLDLSGNQLEALPAFTKALNALRTLNLARNRLTAVPEGFQHLIELQHLDLSENRLRSLSVDAVRADGSHIDNGVTAAFNLVTLNVSLNHLTALPASINRLAQLRELYAASNLLHALPESIKELNRRLTVLNLRRNRFRTEADLAAIWTLAALIELDLSANGLSALPAEVNALTSLSVLRLSGNQLTDLPSLAGLPCWMGQPLDRHKPALYLNDNCFTAFPEALLVLRSLHTLWMDSNPIVSVPAQIGDMTGLRTLSVSLGQTGSAQRAMAPFPGTFTVGNITRLYACDTANRPPGPDGQVPPLALPMFLDDTDIAQGGAQLPEPASRTRAIAAEAAPAPKYPYAVSQMLGVAPHALEDGVTVTTVTGRGKVGVLEYIALFDGHGGPEAVAFCQTTMHKILTQQLLAQPENQPEEIAVQAALRTTFFHTHEQLRAHLASLGRSDAMVGCTATIVLISTSHIYCGNVGDSAALLARHRSETTAPRALKGAGGASADPAPAADELDEVGSRSRLFEPVMLTTVHRPNSRFEASRIVAGGGFVSVERETSACRMHSPNANNGLGVSRAIGDFPMGSALSTEPSIRAQRRNMPTEDLFLILACDGVTDVLPSQELVVIAAGSSMAVASGASASASASNLGPGGVNRTPITTKVPNSSAVAAAAHRIRGWAYALDSHDDLSVVVVDLSGFFREK